MNLLFHDFRHAREILQQRPAWDEIRAVFESIAAEEIVAEHVRRGGAERGPAGGQTSINAVIKTKLVAHGWRSEPFLFDSHDGSMRGWKMDFVKAQLGVEVAFNHAEAVPWIFTRLNLAGEAPQVQQSSRIDVGIAAFATGALKRWARMDGSVGTFELARTWLELMRPIMPIPILIMGLDCEGWAPSYQFRGTRGRSGNELDESAEAGS